MSIAAVVLGSWLWSRRITPLIAGAALIALLLGGLASAVTKAIFGRERPPIELQAVTVGLAAFPSAHAADAAAFFVTAGLTLALTLAGRPASKVLLVVGGAVLAALVGISRLVLAVHWLSDVVAGWALGTAVAITVVMLAWIASIRYRPSAVPVN